MRMLALDTPVSLETQPGGPEAQRADRGAAAPAGPIRAAATVGGPCPRRSAAKLRQGEWHMRRTGGKPDFRPVRYDVQRLAAPGPAARRSNRFAPQPLRFRLQAVPALAPVGDKANVVLLRVRYAGRIAAARAAARQCPAPWPAGIEFAKPAGEQASALPGRPDTQLAGARPERRLDLLRHRALAVRLRVDGPLRPPGEPLCRAQRAARIRARETYRDHYIDLDFAGERTIIIPEPTSERMLPEFRPAQAQLRVQARRATRSTIGRSWP